MGAPQLIVTPGEQGTITVGDEGPGGELESGYRLECTGIALEEDAIRLTVRFTHYEAGGVVRKVPGIEAVVPKRSSLFLECTEPGASKR